MPYDKEKYVVVHVPFLIGSAVYAHLKEESERYYPHIGPHIAALLADRDAHVYGSAEGGGKGVWFPSTYLAKMPGLANLLKHQEMVVGITVEESSEENIAKQALLMAASYDDDDD